MSNAKKSNVKNLVVIAEEAKARKIATDMENRKMPISTAQFQLLINLGCTPEQINDLSRGEAYELSQLLLPNRPRRS